VTGAGVGGRRPGRPFSFLLVAIATLAIAAPLLTTLSSPPAGAAPAEPVFALLSQPAWVWERSTVTLRLDVPASLIPDGEVGQIRLRAYRAVSTTSAFDRTVDGDRLGPRIGSVSQALTKLPRDARGAVAITFGLRGSRSNLSLDIGPPGVYPLEVQLRAGTTLASFVTWVVVADRDEPATTVNPVRLAQVWNAVTAPVRDPEEKPNPLVTRELAPGGRLDQIAALVQGVQSMPVTLQVGPEMLESWQALVRSNPEYAPGYERLKAGVERSINQVLPAPYVPIDITSLEAAGLGRELPDALRTGSVALDDATGVSPDPRTAYVDPADAASLARIQGLLVERIGISSSSVSDTTLDETLTPSSIVAGNGTLPIYMASPHFEDMLTSDAPPALRAQRLLSALAVLTFERDDPSGVVLGTPSHWAPDLATERALLNGIRTNPYIRSVTLDQLFASVPAPTDEGVPPVHGAAPHQPAPFPVNGLQYANAQRELAALRATVGSRDPAVTTGTRALALALSSDNTSARASTYLSSISSALDEVQRNVSATRRRVTVTAREADIPLSFVNDTHQPVTVHVQLASEKLLFPDGSDRQLVLQPGTTTERFAVEARTSGSFRMTVTLLTGDGALRLGDPEPVSVRSAVFSGAGKALTIGALAFLALWWANHFRRTRRTRRAATVAS
jgi:hypothetical protein